MTIKWYYKIKNKVNYDIIINIKNKVNYDIIINIKNKVNYDIIINVKNKVNYDIIINKWIDSVVTCRLHYRYIGLVLIEKTLYKLSCK